MHHPIRSLHHVTATVDTAADDLDFFATALGLRLVKKTINFDNPRVYHFYYGDETGSPGTIWTTFPYHGMGVPTGRIGVGQVAATAFSVPADALEFWTARLRDRSPVALDERFGQPGISVADPSGLVIELVGATADSRAAWSGAGVPAEHAIQGLHHVSLAVRRADASIALLTDLLGLSVVATEGSVTRLTCGVAAPGRLVDVVAGEAEPVGRNGLGTVHHVAFAIQGADEQLALRDDLLHRGFQVTPVMDRQYFQSIYFREPGGVLLEVATMSPGFAVDEAPSRLGEELKLPPWEEPNRAAIAAALPPVAARR